MKNRKKKKSMLLPGSLAMVAILAFVIVFRLITVSHANPNIEEHPQTNEESSYTVETSNDNRSDSTESIEETEETHYELEEEFSNQNVTISGVEY